jgi:hypothetical protein
MVSLPQGNLGNPYQKGMLVVCGARNDPTVARMQHIHLAMIHALACCVIGLHQATSGYTKSGPRLLTRRGHSPSRGG